MMRQNLLVLCATALLASAAPAGELRYYPWPATYVPQEIVAIPVVMDVGFWIEIVNQDDVIKLQQVSLHTYEGCLDLEVRCNFDLTMSCSVTPTGAIEGKYSCYMQDPDVDVPGGTATVCARLENANLTGQPGGSRNIHVATVTVRVVPR